MIRTLGAIDRRPRRTVLGAFRGNGDWRRTNQVCRDNAREMGEFCTAAIDCRDGGRAAGRVC